MSDFDNEAKNKKYSLAQLKLAYQKALELSEDERSVDQSTLVSEMQYMLKRFHKEHVHHLYPHVFQVKHGKRYECNYRSRDHYERERDSFIKEEMAIPYRDASALVRESEDLIGL